MSHTPIAIVLAAGKGERVGGDVPKQLRVISGKPLAAHALDQHLRLGHRVVLVISEALVGDFAAIVAGRDVETVLGGATRRESVLAGFGAIAGETDPDTPVILRNAASPNVPDELVEACIAGLATHYGMQAYRASEETTIVHDGRTIEQVLPRSATGFTCDPTVYRHSLAHDIHQELARSTEGETTLDIARRLGATIGLVVSPPSNIKVTTADDLVRVENARAD
ncbi:MAG: 2-C-methyl-D-erythritol 4-phosphate cytidylyltransferase [Acidimicrobiales bacterium]|nr:2-C-methyl-D-erythritol 4-phosphate cytidylyltransferase [Acidimicrobiales bacterium]